MTALPVSQLPDLDKTPNSSGVKVADLPDLDQAKPLDSRLSGLAGELAQEHSRRRRLSSADGTLRFVRRGEPHFSDPTPGLNQRERIAAVEGAKAANPNYFEFNPAAREKLAADLQAQSSLPVTVSPDGTSLIPVEQAAYDRSMAMRYAGESASRPGSYLGSGVSGIAHTLGGVAKGLELAPRLAGFNPGVGRAFDQAIGDWDTATTNPEYGMGNQVSSAVGSAVPYLLAGAAAGQAGLSEKAAAGAMMGLGGLSGAGAGYDEAKQRQAEVLADPGHNKDEEVTGLNVALYTLARGGIDAAAMAPMSRTLQRFNVSTKGVFGRSLARSMGRPLKDAIDGAIENAAMSMAQQFGTNYAQQVLLGMEKDLADGVAETGATGAVVGSLFSGIAGVSRNLKLRARAEKIEQARQKRLVQESIQRLSGEPMVPADAGQGGRVSDLPDLDALREQTGTEFDAPPDQWKKQLPAGKVGDVEPVVKAPDVATDSLKLQQELIQQVGEGSHIPTPDVPGIDLFVLPSGPDKWALHEKNTGKVRAGFVSKEDAIRNAQDYAKSLSDEIRGLSSTEVKSDGNAAEAIPPRVEPTPIPVKDLPDLSEAAAEPVKPVDVAPVQDQTPAPGAEDAATKAPVEPPPGVKQDAYFLPSEEDGKYRAVPDAEHVPTPDAPDLDVFVAPSGTGKWNIHEGKTGNVIGALFKTKQEAIEQAGVEAKYHAEAIRRKRDERVASVGESPRYTGEDVSRRLPPMVPGNDPVDLSKYAPRFWRETSADDAGIFIFGNQPYDPKSQAFYMANTPDLALGQAKNKGVLLEFNAKGLQGRVNTKKPGWQATWDQGAGEFIAEYNEPSAYAKNLRSVTIKPNATGSRGQIAGLRRAMAEFEKRGWTKETMEDGAVKWTKPDVDVSQQPPAGDHRGLVRHQPGRKTEVALADGRKLPGQYVVMEAGDLIPSHDARAGFKQNPAGDINERPYHDPIQGAESRQTVQEIATKPNPDLLLADTPTAVDGPPIIRREGQVLGGNARSMGMQLAYSKGGDQARTLKASAIRSAEKFGIDPGAVRSMKEPVIVRMLDDGGKPGELSRALNESLTTGRSGATDAVSRASKISQGTADLVASVLGDAEDGHTLREAMDDPTISRKLATSLIRDGVWSKADSTRFIDPKTGAITPEGKLTIESTLVGRVVGDAKLLGALPAGARSKLLASIGSILRLEQSESGKGFREKLNTALAAYPEFKASKLPIRDFFHDQQSMSPPPGFGDNVVSMLVDAMDRFGPRQFKTRMDDLVHLMGAENDTPRLGFGESTEKMTMEDAVREAFSYPQGEKDRTAAAPENASFSNLLPEDKLEANQQTQTPEFKRWFGNSKVVDESGRPLVVYHGTNDKFNKFSQDKAPLFWFSSDRGSIERGESGAAGIKHLMPVYLSIQKMAGWDEYEKKSINELIRDGFDGVKLDNDYIVFEPFQIKSATKNRGTFDPSNPDIRFNKERTLPGDESLARPVSELPDLDQQPLADKPARNSPEIPDDSTIPVGQAVKGDDLQSRAQLRAKAPPARGPGSATLSPAPLPMEEGQAPKPAQKIISDLAALQKRYVRVGKTGAGVAGLYKPSSTDIVVRRPGDVPTAFHELNHGVDDKHGITSRLYDVTVRKDGVAARRLVPELNNDAARAEIKALAMDGSATETGPRSRLDYVLGEAFAVAMTNYAADPRGAVERFPNFMNHILPMIPKEALADIEAGGKDWRRWMGLSDTEKTLVHIQDKPEQTRGLMGWFGKLLRNHQMQKTSEYATKPENLIAALLWDDKAPIMQGIEKAKEMRGIDTMRESQDPAVLVRLYNGFVDQYQRQLETGPIDWQAYKDGVLRTIPGMGGLQWLQGMLDGSSAKAWKEEEGLVKTQLTSEATIERGENLDKRSYVDLVQRIEDHIGNLSEQVDAMKDGPAKDAIKEQIKAFNRAIVQSSMEDKPSLRIRALAELIADERWKKVIERVIESNHARKQRLSGVGAGTESDQAKARGNLAELQKLPAEKRERIQDAVNRYRMFADAMVLQPLLALGRISPAQYAQMKDDHQFYSNMGRVAESGEFQLPFPSGKRLGSSAQPIKKFEGGTEMLGNPYTNLLRAAYVAQREAQRNAAIVAFIDLLEAYRNLGQGDPLALGQIARKVKAGDENAIKVWRDGQLEHWQFEEDIHNALKAWGQINDGNDMMKVAQAVSSALRKGVTMTLPFAIRNTLRDAINRAIISTTGSKPWDSLRKFTPEERAKFDLAGGGQAGRLETTPADYYRRLEESMHELIKDDRNIVVKGLDKGWSWYKTLIEESERRGRLAEFRTAYAEGRRLGKSDLDASLYAALKSRSLLDFSQSGTLIAQMTKVVPFLNAAVQGLRSTIRSAKNDPAGTAIRWSMYVLAPSLLAYGYHAAMGDKQEEEYQQLPAWQRDFYWNFKAGDTWLRFPKPFEMGVLSSGVERMIDSIRGKQGAWDGYPSSLRNALLPVDEGTLAGPFRPLIEAMSNYDSFRNAPIVPNHEAALDVSKREGTSRASAIGRVMQAASFDTMDARNIDHLIRGFAGTTGSLGLGAVDTLTGQKPAVDFAKSLTGVTANTPSWQAKDVAYVLDRAERTGNSDKGPMNALKALLKRSTDKTLSQKERDDAAERARAYASRIRPWAEQLK